AIERRAYSFPWTRGNFIDALAAGYAAEMLLDADQALIGYFVAMPGVDELHLLNLTVDPDWQGRGYSHLLLDAVEARCLQRRASMLWLEVRANNQRARRLYIRRGFTEVGLRRNYYPAGPGRSEDAVVMSMNVTSRDLD
ncbi:MAG: ribosomal protein S18-alanine N-acetyltransferase, partial [Pirellulaceae bacterium]|nr:ribosomal protein S18-alanine N-acetyltransferase [Pirellulaceae bacterium]